MFLAGDGTRKTIRLGKCSVRQAEAFKLKIEDLATAAAGLGTVQDQTARWLEDLPDTLHARLAKVGLTRARNRASVTLKSFLDDFFASVAVKPGTATTYGQTRRTLLDYFGESKPLREIEPQDADKWRRWLKAQKGYTGPTLADSTVSRRVKHARQMFKLAVRWKLIRENPFADVVAGSQSNKARQHFVTRDSQTRCLSSAQMCSGNCCSP